MPDAERVLDQYEQALKAQKEQLMQCQKEHGVDSCLKCPHTIGCEQRLIYVKAVYTSMNKNQGGGFEF